MSEQKLSKTLSSEKYFILMIGILVVIYLTPSIGIEFEIYYDITLAVYIIIPALMTVSAIILYTKHEPIKQKNFKKALLFLAVSMICWFFGEQVWNMYEHVLDGDPYPSYADLFYILAYPFFFLFITFYLRSFKQKISKSIFAFSIVIATAFLIPTVIATYDYEFGDDVTILEISVALIYPIADAIILAPALIALIYGIKNKENTFLTLMMIGFLFIFIADIFFLYAVTNDSYYDAHPIDVFWALGYLTFAYATFREIKQDKLRRLFKIDNNQQVGSITFDAITNVIIPITIITIITVVIMSLIYVDFYSELEENPPKALEVFSTYGIFVILAVFATIIIIINRNLSKIVKIKTDELEEQNKNLEKIIEEKTSELIKKERLSAIGEFSSRIAHDLRNPLASIKGAAELIRIKSKHPDDMILPYFSVIEEGIVRMTHLVDDVLDYVRASPLVTKETNISEIIQLSLDRIKIPAGVKIYAPKNDAMISCDIDKLEIVFINLLMNAVQAIKKSGEIKIKIEEIQNYVSIQFEDSGEGIPKENISKIFQPLFTTKQTGTGLGLASCKNIIEQHGGTLTVKNNPTTFYVNLPKVLHIKNK